MLLSTKSTDSWFLQGQAWLPCQKMSTLTSITSSSTESSIQSSGTLVAAFVSWRPPLEDDLYGPVPGGSRRSARHSSRDSQDDGQVPLQTQGQVEFPLVVGAPDRSTPAPEERDEAPLDTVSIEHLKPVQAAIGVGDSDWRSSNHRQHRQRWRAAESSRQAGNKVKQD